MHFPRLNGGDYVERIGFTWFVNEIDIIDIDNQFVDRTGTILVALLLNVILMNVRRLNAPSRDDSTVDEEGNVERRSNEYLNASSSE